MSRPRRPKTSARRPACNSLTLIVDVGGPRPRVSGVRDPFLPLLQTACRLRDELINDPTARVVGQNITAQNVATPASANPNGHYK